MQTLKKNMVIEYKSMKADLQKALEKVLSVAITRDSWTSIAADS